MSALDWWKVKPSSSPPLSWAEVLALPDGMVVLEVTGRDALPLMILEREVVERRARIWQLGQQWSRPISLLEREGCSSFLRLPRLPRLSFAMTTEAVRMRKKTVTRRLALPSWWKTGAWFLGVDKIRQAGAQGLCIAQCGPASHEPLVAISQEEVVREGFQQTTPEGFCAMFRATAPRDWDGWVWRLPFSYLEVPE